MFNLLKAFATLTVATALTVGASSVAHADTVPSAQPNGVTGQIGDSGQKWGKDFLMGNVAIKDADPNTVATIVFSSCGKEVASKEWTGSGTFSIPFEFDNPQFAALSGHKLGANSDGTVIDGWTTSLGPTLSVSYSFHAPGATDSTYPTRLAFDNLPFVCGASGGSVTSAKTIPNSFVAHWSKKKGTAKVGHKVKITATKLTSSGKAHHTAVTYTWKVKGKIVGHKKALKVKKAWKHGKVTVTVKLHAAGYKGRAKTLSFGKAR